MDENEIRELLLGSWFAWAMLVEFLIDHGDIDREAVLYWLSNARLRTLDLQRSRVFYNLHMLIESSIEIESY